MTGMPSAVAFCTAGTIASVSWARITSASAPRVIRLSTSAICFSLELCASALM